MSKAQGVVERLSIKNWNGTDLHSFQLADNNRWFRTGRTPLPAKEGEYIAFEFDPEKNQVDVDSVEISEGKQVERAPKVAASKFGGKFSGRGSYSKDDYWRAKDARDDARDARYQTIDIPRMTYGCAQDAAVSLVVALMDKGVLTLPSSKNKTVDVVVSYVDQLAQQLFEPRMGPHKFEPTAATSTGGEDADSDEDE